MGETAVVAQIDTFDHLRQSKLCGLRDDKGASWSDLRVQILLQGPSTLIRNIFTNLFN